jgi:N-methylhydantoinase A
MVVNTLATEVSSVGAGGGSIVAVSPSGDITVGPGSAGAAPGPACYGRGGTRPTVTDACLMMGILDPVGFAGGQMELDITAARRAFERLDCAMSFGERIATAWRVALSNIAEEVVNVAIRHGADPRDFSLVAFGAGGPMLLAGALELTGARRLIVPPHPGLFSAIGLLSTDRVHATGASAHHMLVPEAVPAIEKLLGDMEAALRARLPAGTPATVRRTFDGRVLGQSWDTPFVPIASGPIDAAALVRAFHAEYHRRNGQSFPDMPVQGVAWRVQLVAPSAKIAWPELPPQHDTPAPVGARTVRYLADRALEARVYDRADLGAGATLDGPCIIREDLATTLVTPGQRATVGRIGEIVIERLP